jgi:GNAT superfamily N-acetyltransferase
VPEPRTFLRPDGRRFLLGRPDENLPPGELFASIDESDVEHLGALEALGFVRKRRELHFVLPTDVPRRPAPPGVEATRADAVDEATLRLLDDELCQDVPGTDGWRCEADDFLRRSQRRRGIGRWLIGEAFAVLHARGLHEVSAEVDETNAASRALLGGLGGRLVGATVELRRP